MTRQKCSSTTYSKILRNCQILTDHPQNSENICCTTAHYINHYHNTSPSADEGFYMQFERFLSNNSVPILVSTTSTLLINVCIFKAIFKLYDVHEISWCRNIMYQFVENYVVQKNLCKAVTGEIDLLNTVENLNSRLLIIYLLII